jgi:hypothetical protein
MKYEIIVWNGHQWAADEVGPPNRFESESEAWEMIPTLRTLGPDWADAEFQVRPIKEEE